MKTIEIEVNVDEFLSTNKYEVDEPGQVRDGGPRPRKHREIGPGDLIG